MHEPAGAARDLASRKRAEARYYDEIASHREAATPIPLEADLRRARRVPVTSAKDLVVDPTMTTILDGGARERFADAVAHRPGGRVLDICCGSGWLALELGRRGQRVDAYDLSPKALAVARRLLAENPFTDGFGEVNYYQQDVTAIDLGEDTYDAVSGWAAFHHLPDLDGFMQRVWRALKPGGIVATMDDMPRGLLERLLEHAAILVLPTYLTYREKAAAIRRRLRNGDIFREEGFSPMEEAKHSTVFDIERIWRHQYELLTEYRQNAFVGTPAMILKGPDWFRYPAGRALVAADRALCRLGVVKGFDRYMIARKP